MRSLVALVVLSSQHQNVRPRMYDRARKSIVIQVFEISPIARHAANASKNGCATFENVGTGFSQRTALTGKSP
jgi:hypothetical protein